MGYILGVCGVVLGGSLLIYFVYSFYSKRYDLDNGAINAKEDRFYGNVDLEDYEGNKKVLLAILRDLNADKIQFFKEEAR